MKTTYIVSQALCLLALTLAYDSPPSIVTQPQDVYAESRREYIEFECVADGQPAPTYYWKRNGTMLELADNPRASLDEGTLRISSPDESDNGEYQCFANNQLGTAMSEKVNMIFSFLGEFLDTEPHTEAVDMGVPLRFKCGANHGPPMGAPPPSIYWTDASPRPAPIEYDARVNQDPNGNLVFSNVIASDAKGYYCTAFNTIIGVSKVSPKITLNVNADVDPIPEVAASLIYSPAGGSVTTLRTETLKLKCLAEGYPTPSIIWKRDGAQLLTADRVTIETGGQELSISDVEFDDAGDYVCEASNSGGASEATTTVNVEAAPYYAQPPSDEVKGPGETVNIECQAKGVPPPTVDVLVNGSPWADYLASRPEIESRWTVETGQSRTASIEITNLQTSDSTVFQCLATNKYKETLTSVVLNVVSIPAVIQEFTPANHRLTVFQDASATLVCQFEGRPWPDLTWTFKGGELTANDKYSIDADTGELVIEGMQEADSGEYECIVTNSIDGQTYTDSVSADIDVITNTEIVRGPQDQTIREGETARFQCEVSYDQRLTTTPTVYWLKDEARYNAATDNSLAISSAQVGNSGTYTCVVDTTIDPSSGIYQTTNRSAVLTVKGRPSRPENVEVNAREQEFVYTMMFTAGADNNAPIRFFTVQYDTEWENRHWVFKENVTSNTDPTNKEYTLVLHLDPYVRYSFRVIAFNSLGASDPSEVYSMADRTAPAPPTRNPSYVEGSSTDPSSIVIRWEPIEPYYYGGENFQYLISYRVVGSGGDWKNRTVAPSERALIVQASKAYEAYEFTVRSMNAEGKGPEATPEIGYSGEAKPSSAPGDVKVSVLSASEVNVTWQPIPESEANGQMQGYNVYYNRRIASGQERLQCPSSPCVVGGLQPASQYEISVKGYTNAGEGPSSPVVTVTTMEAPPGPVRLKVEAYSYRLILDWKPPIEINGILGGYKISIAPITEERVGDYRNYTFTAEDDTYLRLEENIDPETTYRIVMIAFNGLGEGARVVEEPTTRMAGSPAKPPAPEVDEIKMHNVTFRWDLANLDPTPARVLVEYRKQTDESDGPYEQTEEVDVLDEKEIMVSGLESTTPYEARLQVTNGGGSTLGETTTFKTAGTSESTDPGFVMGTWLIILICVIILLILILLIICIIKSQKGGKYNVSDKEKQLNKDIESTPLKDDGGFDEYKPPTGIDGEPLRGSQGSLNDSEHGSSETDSLKEYADGDMGKFDEEGSFIGQYGDNKKQRPAEDGEPGGGAAYSTFV